MDKQKAFKIVFDDLKKNNMFCGIFDAANGSKKYMHGIATVMEYIANKAGRNEFDDLFLENFVESIKKKNDKEKLNMTVYLAMGMNRLTNRIAVFDVYDNKDSCLVRISERRKKNNDYVYWMEVHDVKESNKYDEEIL